MEVVLPMDFDFDISTYPSLPSTPKRIGEYHFSPPTELHYEFDRQPSNSPATVPFAWEEKPGVPKSFSNDFAFDVSGEFDRHSLSAEDLFDGGLIKLLEPLPRLQDNKESDITAIKESIKVRRERGSPSSFSGLPSSRSRRTKSLSPRGSRYPWEEEEEEEEEQREKQQWPPLAVNTKPRLVSSCSTLSATSSSSKGSRKWSFKDLFLFRSASDGRAMDRDPLKKYLAIFRKHDEDFRNSSIQSMERRGHVSGSGSKRRGLVSAHELHYTVNRAVSNDMKKKTFLPYKQGILGRLAFNPTVHALSNGFGFSHNN